MRWLRQVESQRRRVSIPIDISMIEYITLASWQGKLQFRGKLAAGTKIIQLVYQYMSV